jgi:hypothetical protein
MSTILIIIDHCNNIHIVSSTAGLSHRSRSKVPLNIWNLRMTCVTLKTLLSNAWFVHLFLSSTINVVLQRLNRWKAAPSRTSRTREETRSMTDVLRCALAGMRDRSFVNRGLKFSYVCCCLFVLYVRNIKDFYPVSFHCKHVPIFPAL